MPAIQEEAVESFKTILKNLCPDEIELITKTLKQLAEEVTPKDEEPLIKSLTGRTWNRKEKIELELKTLFRYFDKRSL